MAGAAHAASVPKLGEIVSIGVYDGVLRLEWIGDRPPVVEPIQAQGPESIWRARAPRPTRGMAPGTLTLERPAGGTARPGDYWFISIISTPDQFLVRANRAGKIAHEAFVQMIQRGDGTVILSITQTLSKQSRTVEGKNLNDLRAKYPALFRANVLPLLMQLAGENLLMPGATDVYRAFDEIEPDPQILATVQKLLPYLSAAAYEAREAATARIVALGPRAICAIIHLDRTELPPEAQARLDAIVAHQTRRQIRAISEMRNELGFLADCMEFDDLQVRKAARTRIEQLTARAIPLLPSPTPEEWSSAADAVRQHLAESSKK